MTVEKIPLIVFSGGVDSTYMLNAALAEGDVWTLYVEGRQGPQKSKAEQSARQKILAYFEKMHKDGELKGKVLVDTIVNIGLTGTEKNANFDGYYTWDVDFSGRRKTCFNQPMFWLSGINWVVNADKHKEIQLGYITGDQMAYNLRDMAEGWEKLMGITHREVVPLAFPLKFHNKKFLLKDLRRELADMTWVCEAPRGYPVHVPCHQCDKCKEYEQMYFSIYNEASPQSLLSPEESPKIELEHSKSDSGSSGADSADQRSDQLEEASSGS